MLIQPIDVIIALKMINLAPDLSGTEKRVAAALLDHYNRKSGQCDPSLGRIAALLGVNRRTVIRAINKLVATKYFLRKTHGGHFHRNSYEPLWAHLRELDQKWKTKFRTQRRAYAASTVSPSAGQHQEPGSAGLATQTFFINHPKETFGTGSSDNNQQGTASKERALDKRGVSEGQGPYVKKSPSRIAALDSAEQRWSTALNARLASNPVLYARVLDAIDRELHLQATEAELARKGDGLAHIASGLEKKCIINPGDL